MASTWLTVKCLGEYQALPHSPDRLLMKGLRQHIPFCAHSGRCRDPETALGGIDGEAGESTARSDGQHMRYTASLWKEVYSRM